MNTLPRWTAGVATPSPSQSPISGVSLALPKAATLSTVKLPSASALNAFGAEEAAAGLVVGVEVGSPVGSSLAAAFTVTFAVTSVIGSTTVPFFSSVPVTMRS